MRREQKNITLTKDQIDFMRDNNEKLSLSQMAKKFNCSLGKVAINARLAGISFPARNRHGLFKKASIIESDYFNVDAVRNWVTGFSYGKVY